MSAIIPIIFGLFWLFCAWVINMNGAPSHTVMATAGLGILSLFGGIVRFAMSTSQRRAEIRVKHQTGWRDPDAPVASDSDFDPDAAIKRYLANRPGGAPADSGADEVPAPIPSRPSFGRRTS